MALVDAHTHIWVSDPDHYPWRTLIAGLAPPATPAPVEELMAALDAAGVEQAVVTQPAIYGPDNSYLAESIARYPKRLAGVGLIDPLDPNAGQQLDYWVRERGLRGVRLNPGLVPASHWFNDPNQDHLWRVAEQLSIPISLRIAPEQLAMLDERLRDFPGVSVVIDYLNPVAFDDAPAYKAFHQLAALAKHARLFVKVLPLAGHSHEAYPYSDLFPAYQALYDAFGARRLIWGSSWPDTRNALDHQQAVAWGSALPFLAEADRVWLLGGTAAELWRLS